MTGLSDAMGEKRIEIELGGQKYTMSPITIGDFAKLEGELRMAKAGELRQLATIAGLDKFESLKYINDEISKIDILDVFTGQDNVSIASQLDKLVRVMYYCIKPNHPGITLDEIYNHIGFASMETISTRLSELLYAPSNEVGDEKNE